MKRIIHHLHHHIRDHHKHYLFGIFGGYALFKLFLLLMGITVVQYTYTHTQTFAQLDTGCALTGQYYTGEYLTGEYLTGQELTGGYLTGCEIIPGYRTGGTLNESGDLVDQIRVEESQTGCILTGQELTGGYLTGSYMTGGYRTGGTIVCVSGTQETGTLQQQNIVILTGICESGDVVLSAPLSGSIVRDGISIQMIYSGNDCRISGLSLQLRDHNNQRISLGSFASGTASYAFDSRRLYSFQYSGLYHIIGNTGAGNFMLYSGQYTGSYSRFFTGYKLRLLRDDQAVLHEIGPFTIDNQYPTISGVTLTYSGSLTGYVPVSGLVTLSFVSSELLSGVNVTIGSGKVPTVSTVSGNSHTYTRRITSLYPETPLVAKISFADMAGNTGTSVYTSSLIFDITKPTITGFVFSESSSGLALAFASSEPVNATYTYRRAGASFITGVSANYLTAHTLMFNDIQRDLLYVYSLDFADRAGNTRSVTGDFMRTNLGQIISHVNVAPVVDTGVLSGNVATLATILKSEVNKFTTCKEALTYTNVELEIRRNIFVIQMPDFKKSQVKTLVNAFTLFVLDKVKKNYQISKSDIEEITKKFDNFLIILKLLRDDDNTCKQNLSNYHIDQFQKALEEYNITL